MIDTKRCTCCSRLLDVCEFDFKKTNNGRKRRKEVCRGCLAKQKEYRSSAAAKLDPRDYRPDLERAIDKWIRTRIASSGRSSGQGKQDTVSCTAPES